MSLTVFSSLHEFFSMNGYAFQVWGALVVTLIIIVILLIHTLCKQNKLRKLQMIKRVGKKREQF